SPPTNLPFWSLSYEFWYYVAFGVATLIRPARLRNLMVLVVLLIAGPAILLLMPCWLVGVALFVFRNRISIPAFVARLCFVLSLAAMLLAIAFLPQFPFTLGHKG